MRSVVVAWMIGLVASCAAEPPMTTPTPEPESFVAPEAGVITVVARDGTVLEADYYPQAEPAPGLVLLHMIPPNFDRTSWPSTFIDAMFDAGFSVLVVDRRGAGGSEGVAVDAYVGPKGRTDVEACVLRLTDDGYGPIGIIGASNGTTSMVDYAVWAPSQGLPEPVGLGFMTGGAYTETNNAMADLPPIPAVYTYSTEERDWSVAQQPLDPGTWSFLEYADGDHGTLMFDADPTVTDDLVEFFGPLAPAP
jgi:pimeloyl-ACP methyl ester carboxylesterase